MKSIKNYTTTVPANRSIQLIQDMLVENGAKAVLLDYEEGTGRIESLSFQLKIMNEKVAFKLPTNWRKFQEILKQDNITRWNDEDHVYRVAWKNMFDWVAIQMVVYKLNMVQLQEIFLPYAITKNGKTIYESMLENPKLLLD